MDINKLRELSPELNKQAVFEELEGIPASFFEFINNDISNFSLIETKTGITADVTPRALNRWIEKAIVNVNNSDKGKVKRFTRLESIWIKIVVQLREFGVSLKDLEYIRTQLFDYTIENFCLFKFKVLYAILYQPEYLVIDNEHQVGFYSYKGYSDKVSKGYLFSHINIRFLDFIIQEFPNSNFKAKFNIKDIENNVEKLSLLFYLRTNAFKEMRITISDGDVRLLSNSFELRYNDDLLKAIQEWSFKSVVIQINKDTKFVIEN
ncbi:hypothetical protein KRX57_04935 [Weeksellaceae bacterium TAE3-ERU29]|nr:hypothetical protein [Weeksellaceae bacterium TAE3-ERU29]